jgi:acyl-CoA thioesterase-1
MNTVIFHFVCGDAFFSGLIGVACGAVLIAATRGKQQRIGVAAILLGWVFMIASATALPMFQYAGLGFISLGIVAGGRRQPTSESNEAATETDEYSKPKSLQLRWCPALCVIALATAYIEFASYHPTRIQVSRELPVFVIGDSLSAGINDGVDIPWPTRLDEIASVRVSNNALAGATCRSAIKQLDSLPKQCVVIVEIGGNDLLGGRSAAEFRAALDALLAKVRSPKREVVMFELPLPPLFNGYGYAQRELADKYNVDLIPRRLLASVLFSRDATLDSIHLSNDGHRQLAERMANFLSLDNLE